MRHLIHIITSGARHLLVMLAIAAVVMMSVGFHVHSESDMHAHAEATPTCNHAGHAVTKFSGQLRENTSDTDPKNDPSGTLDPDGCGHCHCQVPTTDLPVTVNYLNDANLLSVLLLPTEPVVLDGISLQPEPPPIRS